MQINHMSDAATSRVNKTPKHRSNIMRQY